MKHSFQAPKFFEKNYIYMPLNFYLNPQTIEIFIKSFRASKFSGLAMLINTLVTCDNLLNYGVW